MRNKFIPLGDGERYVNTSTGEVIDSIPIGVLSAREASASKLVFPEPG